MKAKCLVPVSFPSEYPPFPREVEHWVLVLPLRAHMTLAGPCLFLGLFPH